MLAKALLGMLRGARRTGTATAAPIDGPDQGTLPRILIVGSPNVGKSLLFHRLTGHYVVVSNYPGTTVEVSRGRMRHRGAEYEIVDTPGMYSLRPISDEERVARDMLLREPAALVVHVADAKNLNRMLPLTVQLIEADLPVILVANMMDEAEALGLEIDVERLGQCLGVPVVPTAAVTGRGMPQLRNTIDASISARPVTTS